MPRKRIMREFRIDEISGVDNPAQEGARVAIMKRAEPKGDIPPHGSYSLTLDTSELENMVKSEMQKGMGDLADLLTSEEEGHQHGIGVSRCDGEIAYYVSYASGPDDEAGHSHPLARSDSGYVLGIVAGHTHAIDQESMSRAVLALMTKANVGKGEETMTDKTEKATDTQPTVEELQARLARTQAVVALNTKERTHFDALPEEAQTAFLAKSADDRKAEIEAVAKAEQDADPVVYKTDAGVELRKSAGEALIEMAKANDRILCENAGLRKEREQDALVKRAEAELQHLPGDVKTRAAVLKAIDGIEDAAQREAAHNALKAQDGALAKAFETRGHGGQPEPGSPDDQLDKLAKAHAEKEGVSYQAAYADVLTSTEGRALYAKTVNQEVRNG